MTLVGAALVVAAIMASTPPTVPPPKVAGVAVAPPPAWVEAGPRSVWATHGSYCWSTPGKSAACVDMIPPGMRPDLARLATKAQSLVRFHLRFTPRTVRVYRLSGAKRTLVQTGAGRTVSWRARPGIFDVETTGARGSASYVVRLT